MSITFIYDINADIPDWYIRIYQGGQQVIPDSLLLSASEATAIMVFDHKTGETIFSYPT